MLLTLFDLDTDAYEVAIKVLLNQVQEGTEKVYSFGSCSLAAEQRRHCINYYYQDGAA